MKSYVRIACLATLLLGATPTGFADSASSGDAPCERIAPAAAPTILYQPPHRGAPARRVGGGTRSIGQLTALSPPGFGVSTRTEPRLYWYLDPGYRNGLRFLLRPVDGGPPLLEVAVPPQPDGGIRHLHLGEHGVRLEQGRTYEWAVVLEPEPHQRWPALVSRGLIAVEAPPPALREAALQERPFLAARLGIWYDALEDLSRLMDARGGDRTWRLLRADLLDQGGLRAAAMYERQRTSPRD